jgi:integrase
MKALKPGPDGPLPGLRGRVWPAGDIRTAFENAVEEANLDDFHFHDCRHHFASWFVMRGGSLQALQRILGHASLTMTQRYAHLSPDYLRSEVARTERRADPASDSTQGSTQEVVQQVGVSQKSL